MFLVIYELIDKMSGSLGGDHDGVDHVIGDRLNKVIVGFNIYPKTIILSAGLKPYLMFLALTRT